MKRKLFLLRAKYSMLFFDCLAGMLRPSSWQKLRKESRAYYRLLALMMKCWLLFALTSCAKPAIPLNYKCTLRDPDGKTFTREYKMIKFIDIPKPTKDTTLINCDERL